MDFFDPKLDEYVVKHTATEPAVLAELNRQTHLKVLQPRMLSGHFQGRVLSMITHMVKPKNILEVGTYTGYSALCMAEGLVEGGQIDTIDINEELEPIIRKYISEAGAENKITFHVGNALDIVPTLDKTFDLVFIDADKENYINYFNLVIDRVPVGGYIIADNVLWSGKVLDKKEIENDLDTRTIVEYNAMIQNDDRVENVLFPIRDGLMVARKVKNS